jgi:hypothetical protein
MTPLTKVGKRLDNITRYILDNNPQDKWVLSNIVPMFLEAIKSSTTIQEEQIIISQLNKLLDNFEFRYNQIFEGKNKIAHQINQNLQELIEKIKKDFNIQEEKTKRDRCLRIADRKFDKPSAYKSGAVVRCRKGDIWKDLKEEQLDESKQVGTIYHYTTFENGLKILQSNELKGGAAEDSTNTNPVFAISFTRDKRFHNNHNVGFDVSSFGQRPQVRFTVDGNKLSNRYKIQPYAQIGGSGRFEKQREEFEAEERVVSNKPFSIPILSYIESVDILIEYKKPRNDDWDMEWGYKTYAPISAELVKFAQDKNLPINLIVNKNGDPWPDKIKPKLINKILNWFTIKETDNPQSGKAAPYGSGYAKLKDIIKEILLEDESLRKWFSRKGEPGKKGGWVDCNTCREVDGKTKCKACGREKGEKRAKYPSCRPTAAQCKTPGKGKKWGKTK